MNWPDPDSAAGPLGDGRLATAIDRPSRVEELQEIVRRRVSEGMAIYPQGGRTALDYGGVPRRPGAAVDMTGMDRVIDYPAADMTITVEAGITLAEIARVLDVEGQRLAIDAPRPDRATVGGVFATNSTGPRRFGLGRPRDQIIGVGFVTADGNLVKGGGRVVKNVAGYDFPRLLTGSMGTLGAIAHVTLKVRPKPEATALLVASYSGLEDVARDLERLNTSSTRPVAVELMSRLTSGRLEGATPSEWTLVLGFEGNADAVAWQLDRAATELSGRSESVESEAASRLWVGLRELNGAEVGPVSIVANVRPSAVVPFASLVDPAFWSLQSHAASGVVRCYSLIDEMASVEADVHRLRIIVEEGGGNLLVSRCPTDRKEALKVWGNPRPDWDWSGRVKAALDPGGVMNPGRFVGTI